MTRFRHFAGAMHICLICFVVSATATRLSGQVFRWDNGEMIPGTDKITLGPGVDLAGAQLEFADLSGRHSQGIFFDLTGANLAGANLYGADLSGADLTLANLSGANLTDASLYATTITSADLSNAIIAGVSLSGKGTGLTKEQFYSTRSYRDHDLRGIRCCGTFSPLNMRGWNLSGQDLTGSRLSSVDFSFVDLSDANLSDAYFTGSFVGANLSGTVLIETEFYGEFANANLSTDFTRAWFDGSINQWTMLPVELFAEPDVNSPVGDFDASGTVDVADINVWSNSRVRSWLNTDMFDLNQDAIDGDLSDFRVLIHDVIKTYFGDANLDGEFDSGDLVDVFQAGLYETGSPAPWSSGDWNGDGGFNSSDLVVAFADGGYEQGPRVAVAVAVPEPTSGLLAMIAATAPLLSKRRAQTPK